MSRATCPPPEAQPFETQMVDWIKIWKQFGKLDSASSGTLDPGELAETVFGDLLESGQLFLYLFRRFGAPIDPYDDYKECCEYHFTTPRPDVWLGVSINGLGNTGILFRYGVTLELGERLRVEDRALVRAWHAKKDRWCRGQGMDLPELPPYPSAEDANRLTEDEWNAAFAVALDARNKYKDVLDEALARYAKAHPEQLEKLHHTCGPLKTEVNQALLATLRDLKRAVYIRDVYFNPHGRLADCDLGYDEKSETTLFMGRPAAEYCTPHDNRIHGLQKEIYRLELKCGEKAPDGCALYHGPYKNVSICPHCGKESEDPDLNYGFDDDLWTETRCPACEKTYLAITRGDTFVLSSKEEQVLL